MEFKVGQQFRVPNITWTISKIIGYCIWVDIVYDDGSVPEALVRWRVEEFRAVIDRARARGRLIEDPVEDGDDNE